MSDLIDRNAVLKLARDVCVPVGDDGVYRTRIISPQAVKEIPATAVPEELSEEAVAIEVAPQSLQSTMEWLEILKNLTNMGYVICRRIPDERT